MPDEQDGNYGTGYGKPPAHTRFTKGRSGNPKGRPRGSRSLESLVQSLARETVTVTESGRKRRVSKVEAVLRQLWAQALSGDHRAMKEVLSLKQVFDAMPDPADAQNPDNEKNRAVLESFLARARSMNFSETPSDTTTTQQTNGEDSQ